MQDVGFSYKRALGELFFAALLWGFSFVASRWGLLGTGPGNVSFFRFLLAFLAALPFLLFLPSLRPHLDRLHFTLSAVPGILLSTTILLQVWGLKYTSVAKSGFITCLYIIFVPLMESLILKVRIRARHWLFVFIALVGAYLICDIHLGGWNVGDLATLLCAITSAWHIVQTGEAAKKVASPFMFNSLQVFWGTLVCLGYCLFYEGLNVPVLPISWLGILVLAVPVHLVAFTIQVRAQQILPPSTVSMFFLLESPFAALFGYLLFHEHLSALQLSGALLILVAAYLTSKLPAEPIRTIPDTKL